MVFTLKLQPEHFKSLFASTEPLLPVVYCQALRVASSASHFRERRQVNITTSMHYKQSHQLLLLELLHRWVNGKRLMTIRHKTFCLSILWWCVYLVCFTMLRFFFSRFCFVYVSTGYYEMAFNSERVCFKVI